MTTLDEKFWVATAFILFVSLVYKMLKRIIIAGLDSKISDIKYDLNRAEQLKIEAQDILQEVKIKEEALAKDAEKIILNANTRIKNLEKQSEKNIIEEIQKKTLTIKKGFKIEKDIFITQLSQNIINEVFTAVEAVVKKQKSEFVDNYTHTTIEELKQKNL
ncbi:MAG: hypothetical protein HOM96_00445 [Rickettsiales bacterium]|jgi:F0F1-type ATP synthase membrane subunit b/b'|nr:hypothetical protein [Rickettsiales bacterium]